ncbi:MAG TPA: hypothetical protein VGV38_03320, partial [Pyrinomonadaceae bacterium]|nr:hypothetical protein [Pyrinomonadaceae bacterium]
GDDLMRGQPRPTAAIILSTLGVLFMIAMAFGVLLPRTYALFFGVACFILAGMVGRIAGRG